MSQLLFTNPITNTFTAQGSAADYTVQTASVLGWKWQVVARSLDGRQSGAIGTVIDSHIYPTREAAQRAAQVFDNEGRWIA